MSPRLGATDNNTYNNKNNNKQAAHAVMSHKISHPEDICMQNKCAM